MNLTDSMRTLRKRWILTSLLLFLVLAATAAAVVKLPKSYQSSSTVAFLASKSSAKASFNNPYLGFDSSLSISADVVGRRMMDPMNVSALAAQGYSSSYQVVDAPNSPGPVLLVTVTDHNKAAVQHTLRGVTDAIGTQLMAMQAGIAPENRITDTVLSFSLKPTLLRSKMARPIAAVLVLGLVLAIGTPLIVEGISARRRNRNEPTDRWSAGRTDDISHSYRPSPMRARNSAASAGFKANTGFKANNGKSS
jgi:hypothetical protein